MAVQPLTPPQTAPWGSVTWCAVPNPLAIALRGEIDIALEDTFDVVLSFLEHSTRSDVALCLHDVTFLDSTGLDFLVRVQDHVDTVGTSLHLVAPSSAVRWVLRIAGMGDLFSTYDADTGPALACGCRVPRIGGIVALVPLQRTAGSADTPGTVDGLAS
jgi:anti-anti-sigma factor